MFLSAQIVLPIIIPSCFIYFYPVVKKSLIRHFLLLPQPQISFPQRVFSDCKSSIQWENPLRQYFLVL